MIVGMDFGTTNSGMAVFDGREVTVLPLDPSNRNPRVARTALYVTNDQQVTIGRAAIDRYLHENIGRPLRLQRVWLGEVDVRGADMHFVQDLYAWIDVFSPGRLLLSIKTSLRDIEFQGTVIGQFFYSLEKLIALYLMQTRKRAEIILGQPVQEVVLGRPVRFAFDPEQDKLAQARLLKAAFLAGYEKVYLQAEPIAAAYHYALTLNKPENILMFDFGGGTLDVTIMRLSGSQYQVLSTGGIPVAGDVFDQKLIRTKLPPHFGEGSTYGPRNMPTPTWIYDTFSNWQTILELQTPENKRILREMAAGSQRPQEFENLIKMVSGNYSLLMFDAVEQAKRELSERVGTMIKLQTPDFKIFQLVTRGEFEQIIHHEVLAIDEHLDEMVAAAGLRHDQIDTVIRTGGSAQIPIFHQLLEQKFGPEKVQSIDVFSSVTSGLGVIAHRIQQDEAELPAYTKDDLAVTDPKNEKPQVNPINLEWVKRRIEASEAGIKVDPATLGLVMIAEGKQIAAATINRQKLTQDNPIPLQELFDPVMDDIRMLVTAELDEPLLIVTSRYRFLRLTVQQLLDLQELGMTLFDLHQFGQYEYLTGAFRWNDVKTAERFVVPTTSGFARPYFMDKLQPLVDGPMPLTFDRLLDGSPLAVLGASSKDELLLITETGTATRIGLRTLRTVGSQALKLHKAKRIVGALPISHNQELLAITEDGFAKRFQAYDVPLVKEINESGRSLIARNEVRILTPFDKSPLWLVTNKRLVQANPTHIPLEDSTKSYMLLPLSRHEKIYTALQ